MVMTRMMEQGLGEESKEGRNTVMGRNKRPNGELDQAHFGNFKEQSESSFTGLLNHLPETV